MSFTPTLFISIGETGAMYTLRETHPHYVPGPGPYGNAVVNGVYQGTIEIRDHHVCNLSNNPVDAYDKAVKRAEKSGLRLTTKRQDIIDGKLRKIRRATKDDMELRRRKAEIREFTTKLRREIMRRRQVAEIRKCLGQNIMPIGRHSGASFAAIPKSYLHWLITSEFTSVDDPNGTMALVQDYIKKEYGSSFPVPNKNTVAGEPKTRKDFDVVVIKSVDFFPPSFSGYGAERVYITTMVDQDNNCLVCFSTAFSAEVGEKLKIKATIKEHKKYKDQMQTIVQRVKVLEEKES